MALAPHDYVELTAPADGLHAGARGAIVDGPRDDGSVTIEVADGTIGLDALHDVPVEHLTLVEKYSA